MTRGRRFTARRDRLARTAVLALFFVCLISLFGTLVATTVWLTGLGSLIATLANGLSRRRTPGQTGDEMPTSTSEGSAAASAGA